MTSITFVFDCSETYVMSQVLQPKSVNKQKGGGLHSFISLHEHNFLINDNWYLVDLPGYGYARTSKELIAGFSKINHDYIANRPNLLNLFVLIDIRLEPQEIDLKFLRWLGSNGVPFTMVFTKADKLTRNKIQSHLAAYKKIVLLEWEEMPPFIVTSAESGDGKEELLKLIEEINGTFGFQALTKMDKGDL